MENDLTLESEGSVFRYKLSAGRFHIAENGELDLSVEADILDRDRERGPREFVFAVTNCDYRGAGTIVDVADQHQDWTGDDGAAHAFVYSGFHHISVQAQVKVVAHDRDQMTIEATVLTDNVRIRGGNANDTTIRIRCALSRGAKNDVWGP